LTATAFTGALAVAAHAFAGGGLPSGGAAALLIVVASTTGLLAATDRASHGPALAAVLAGGQLASHGAMAATSHPHNLITPDHIALSWFLMMLAHTLAVAAGAWLMLLSEWLFRSLCRVLRRCATVPAPVAESTARRYVRPEEQPLQHVLLLAASISHRGPPAWALP